MNRVTLTLPQAVQQAATAYSRGTWAEAERLCREILEARGDDFDALNLLGIIAAQTRRTEEAADLLGRAVAAKPGDAVAHSNYGNVLKDLKRFDDALGSYERALQIKPDYVVAHNNRGNTLQELNRFEDALNSYERALKIKPYYAEAYNNRGVTLQKLERFKDALDSYERALKIRPDYAEAYYNRGNALQELKRFDEALESYVRALKLKPDYAEAYYNRGNALQELKRFDDALDSYQRALKIKPDHAEAYNNRGVTLHELNRFEDALDSYARALTINPGHAEAYNNRGNTLQELNRFDDALDSYARALNITPDYAEAYSNRGVTLKQLGRFDEALESYACALTINPDHVEAHNNRGHTLLQLKRFDEALDDYARALQIAPDYEGLYGAWLHTRLHLCDWTGLASHITMLVAKIEQAKNATPPFPVLALTDSLSLQRRAAETWVNESHPVSHLLSAIGKRGRGAKIRIGYYSADFHDHATAYLTAELFEKHDRERFELAAFSFEPDKRDDMRKRLSAAFDRFLDVGSKSDVEVARMSRQSQIDIAVDLNGFTRGGRTGIFSCRAAPIQVNYLGYPGTMGAQYIDYIIADQTLIPKESRQQYAEKVVYLPHSYQVNDRKRRIADKDFPRAELGLPSTGFIFCCFNNTYKITPDMFDGWMRILKSVQGSVLWLLGDNERAAGNLRKEAESRDVDARRLIFARRMPLAEHLARHRSADLFLDTLPYNAHTTASDALWAGLPVLTCMGESFAARVAASLLNAIGLPELVTTTQEQYEATAIELASSPGRLAEIRERLQRNRLTMPLFDSAQFTRHLENAYTQMYERYYADLGPEHIYVAP